MAGLRCQRTDERRCSCSRVVRRGGTDLDHHPPRGWRPQNGVGALVGVSVGVVEHHHSWTQHSPGRSATPWSGWPPGRPASRRRRHNQRVKMHNISWVTGACRRTHRPSDFESAEPRAGRYRSRPPRSAEKRALAGASALLASFRRSMPATRGPCGRSAPARLFGASAAEQDHMTQIGLPIADTMLIDILLLLRIKIWQTKCPAGSTQRLPHRPSRRRQSLAPSNLATSD
jgi:hypothetical protein